MALLKDALFTGEPSLQCPANYLFVFETIKLGITCILTLLMRDFIVNFFVLVTSYLTDIPDKEGACQLMVSAVPGHWDKEEVEHRGSHPSSQ